STVIDERRDQIREGPTPSLPSTASPELPSQGERPSVALWTPSLVALMLSGVSSGCVLGTADALAFHFIAGGFPTPFTASAWGAALGTVGGALIVVLRRMLWGREVSVD